MNHALSSPWLSVTAGDPLPERWGPGPIFGDGPSRWHALTCRPQQEPAAEAWLARRGVFAFFPVTRRRRVWRGRERVVLSRYLPGYIFARFPGPALPHRMEPCPMITGAIRVGSGEWGCLNPFALRRIIGMREVDRTVRGEERRRRREARRFNDGDRATVLSGLFAGRNVEVAEIGADGDVRFRVEMVGTSVLASAAGDQLERRADSAGAGW